MRRVQVVGLLVCVLALAWAPAARAEQAIDDDPTVSGPSNTVETVIGAGWEGDLLRTLAEGQGREEVNGAEWNAPLSGGTYEVSVWIPRGYGGTYVRYLIAHKGGVSEVRLRQAAHEDVWVTLGTFEIDGPTATVRSTDAGGIAGQSMVWDAVRWTKVDPAVSTPDPAADEHLVDDPVIIGPAEYVTTFVGVGYDGDLLRTYAEGSDHRQINGAEWRTPLTSGRFRVQVYIPSEHGEGPVRYFVPHVGGEREILIDQSGYSNVWVDLGEFDLAGPEGVVRSTDATGTRGNEVAWDAVRWVRVPSAPQAPATDPGGAPSSDQPGSDQPQTGPPATANSDGAADPDGDGVPNVLDACDGEHRGALDSNGDGCPGPTKVLARQTRRMVDATKRLLPSGALVGYRIDNVRITRPHRSKIRVRCGPCLFLIVQARPGKAPRLLTRRILGSVSRKSLLRKTLRPGSRVEVFATRPMWIGRYYAFKFGRKSFTRAEQCLTPPENRRAKCR